MAARRDGSCRTLVTRNAPLHYLVARVDFALTYTAPDEVLNTVVVVSVVPDAVPSNINFDSLSPFPLIPDAPADEVSLRAMDFDLTCADECLNGFSVFVDRVAGSTEGTITVGWSVVASIREDEGNEPEGVEFEVRLD